MHVRTVPCVVSCTTNTHNTLHGDHAHPCEVCKFATMYFTVAQAMHAETGSHTQHVGHAHMHAGYTCLQLCVPTHLCGHFTAVDTHCSTACLLQVSTSLYLDSMTYPSLHTHTHTHTHIDILPIPTLSGLRVCVCMSVLVCMCVTHLAPVYFYIVHFTLAHQPLTRESCRPRVETTRQAWHRLREHHLR